MTSDKTEVSANDANPDDRKLSLQERLVKYAQADKDISKVMEARLFIMAHADELQSALAKGIAVKLIWETLYEEKSIGCDYTIFCKLMKSLRPKKEAG